MRFHKPTPKDDPPWCSMALPKAFVLTVWVLVTRPREVWRAT